MEIGQNLEPGADVYGFKQPQRHPNTLNVIHQQLPGF